jgi:hypothetical protein
MTHTTIEAYIRNAYGEERVYLTDKDQAAAISVLTGCKTLTPLHIRALERLGFEVEFVAEPGRESKFRDKITTSRFS